MARWADARATLSSPVAARTAFVVVVVSAFGPYLVGGVRTEQAVVYLLGVAAVPLFWGRWGIGRDHALLAALWTGLVGVAALGLVRRPENTSTWPLGSPLANLDNVVLPLVTLLLIATLAHQVGPARALQDCTIVTAVGVAGNAVVALVQVTLPSVRASLGAFWGDGGTVERSLTMGRYTGLFGQPSVASILYSIGVLAAAYAFRRHPVLAVVVLSLVTVGGTLTASKHFLFFGLPMAAILGVRALRRCPLPFTVATLVTLGSAVMLLIVSGWRGWTRLARMFPEGRLDLAALTGNRYGAGGVSSIQTEAVLRDHPVVGYGAWGLATSTDGMLAQALVLAGLVGVVLVLAAHVWITAACWRRWPTWSVDQRWLFVPLVLGSWVFATGSPVFTLNRVAVVLWTLLALLLVAPAEIAEPVVRPGQDRRIHRLRRAPRP